MRVCDVVMDSIWYDPRVRKQLLEYKAKGIDICAVGYKCNRYDPEKLSLIPCPATIVEVGSDITKKRSILSKLKNAVARNNAVRDAIIAWEPDVIHANDLDALFPAYLAARRLKCKLVYDSHEINVENYTTGGRSPLAFLLTVVEKYLVRRVDLMVCVSHAAADYFAEKYKIPKPMVVTNCSLQKENVYAPEEKHPGFEVLNHGQFYAGRGYDVMVEAAQYLKDYSQIKLAMRGFGVMEQQLRDRVDELKADNVIFYPKVLVQELIPYASRSMVGVAMTEAICLNFKLSVSNKLFEYASAGLPVIMSDIPEHRYLNEKYNFGIVLEDNSPETFAKAAIRLYEDKALYEKLAQNARRLSAEVNWETEFGRLLDAEKAVLRSVKR